MKAFGLSLGVFAMSFTFFVGNPSSAQAEVEEELDWICCQSLWGLGCVDKGGGEWPDDIKIWGSQPTCTVY